MAMHASTLSYQHCQQYKLYEHNRTNQSTGLLVAQVYYKQKLHQRLCNEIIMVSLAYVKLKATNFIYLIILFNRNSLDCWSKIQIMLTIKTRSKWEKKLWAEPVFRRFLDFQDWSKKPQKVQNLATSVLFLRTGNCQKVPRNYFQILNREKNKFCLFCSCYFKMDGLD